MNCHLVIFNRENLYFAFGNFSKNTLEKKKNKKGFKGNLQGNQLLAIQLILSF